MPQGQFPTVNAGTNYTASLIQSLAVIWARKDADTPRSNTVSPAADPDLLIPMVANGIYLIIGYLFATGASISTGDILANFTGPAGSVLSYTLSGWSTASTSTVTLSPARNSGNVANGVNGTTPSPVQVQAWAACGVTAGNFVLNWSQNSSNATATTLKRGSWLIAIRTA